MEFSGKVYEILKWATIIFIPATATLLGSLLPSYGVDPNTVRIILLTLGAVETFIGTLIGISTAAYKTHAKIE